MRDLRGEGSILLVSCYELGHQPLGVAMPVGFLRRAGYLQVAIDIAVEKFDAEIAARARFVGISVPMHTAMRLGVRVIERLREINPNCDILLLRPVRRVELRVSAGSRRGLVHRWGIRRAARRAGRVVGIRGRRSSRGRDSASATGGTESRAVVVCDSRTSHAANSG